MQSQKNSDPIGGFLAILVIAFALYTLQRLPDLMVAMDHAAGIPIP